MIAKTLMLTTKCKATCRHCPFHSMGIGDHLLSLDEAKSILTSFREKMLVISGREPFEYPFLHDLLRIPISQDRSIRIATGGYVDIEPWIGSLKSHPNFEGISLGTDVLSSRCSRIEHFQTWRQNLETLNKHGIPYSLTFTLGEDLEPVSQLIEKFIDLYPRPQFIYLRAKGEDMAEKMKDQFYLYFPNVPIIFDQLGV